MKFILYMYYRINKFYYSFFEDFAYIDNAKATRASPGFIIVGICEVFAAFSIVQWLKIATSIQFTSTLPLFITGLIVIAFHYFTFYYKNRLHRFYREVKDFSTTKKIIWDILVILTLVHIVAAFIVTINELDKYRPK